MPLEILAKGLKRRNKVGGADGIRTHDLLDAIEARSQLRHGPTECGKQLKNCSILAAHGQTTNTQRFLGISALYLRTAITGEIRVQRHFSSLARIAGIDVQ